MKHMRIVGVIDILSKRAVHARAGNRSAYVPIERAAGVSVDGDVEALARVYVETLGVRELYVADLDAIARGGSAMNGDLIGAVAALGVPTWVDAGVTAASDATQVIQAGASLVIVGLETLSSFSALTEICGVVGGPRVAFSLDLRNDVPLSVPNDATGPAVESLVAQAAGSGAETVIVLDLARVGTGAGVDLELMRRVRRTVPAVALFAGGGVRDDSTLRALEGAGVDGALVATALLNGSIKV